MFTHVRSHTYYTLQLSFVKHFKSKKNMYEWNLSQMSQKVV